MTDINHNSRAFEAYDRSMDRMTEAARSARADGINLKEFLPALLDFTAAVAFSVGGEDCRNQFITRLQGTRSPVSAR